ncbi:MAG: hypothetical protein CMJ70_21340 [Planctomycetaceae bacterium]|nr:hypothetical protein [Planctomycetaceae bacterium]HAA70783.1 hypothetical protein [Planctomycetaceae bacterium]|tara:strand:+ start:1916 stop:2188 length:273 start_codon:yes stop_codon:yes gene_type:complete
MQRTELSPREDEKVGVAKPTDESPAVVMADDEEDLDDFDEDDFDDDFDDDFEEELEDDYGVEDDFGTLPDSDEDFEEDDDDELPEEGITP